MLQIGSHNHACHQLILSSLNNQFTDLESLHPLQIQIQKSSSYQSTSQQTKSDQSKQALGHFSLFTDQPNIDQSPNPHFKPIIIDDSSIVDPDRQIKCTEAKNLNESELRRNDTHFFVIQTLNTNQTNTNQSQN